MNANDFNTNQVQRHNQTEMEKYNEQMAYSNAPLQDDNMGKWELDTDPWLNRVFNELLGRKLDQGIWVDDPNKIAIMNEKGASAFINDISSRVSIHMQMSNLTEQDIIEIASRAAQIFADKLEDNWQEWKIEPSMSNLESIGQKMYDMLYIMLKIAEEGGMLRHREKKGAPQFATPEPQGGMI